MCQGVFGTSLAPIALTCSLRISDSPTSDNLTPQEATNLDAPEMGVGGGDLSCPSSHASHRFFRFGRWPERTWQARTSMMTRVEMRAVISAAS